MNIYISCTLSPWLWHLDIDFTLKSCFFRSTKLTKNNDSDKYKYSGYGIGFDSRSEFSFTDGSMGENVIIFWADMSSSVQIDNTGKYILIVGEEPLQGSDVTTLTAEAMYPINFTQPDKRFVLSLQYNGSNSFSFVNAAKNISIQSKKLWNKRWYTVFRKYFKRFYN